MKISEKIGGWDAFSIHPDHSDVYCCHGLVMAHPATQQLECLQEGVEVVPHPRGIVGFDESFDDIQYNVDWIDDYVFVKPNRWMRRMPGNVWIEAKIPIIGIHKQFIVDE